MTTSKKLNKVFSGYMFNIYQWPQKMYDGSTSIFELVTRPDAVAIFALTEDNHILITKEKQPDSDDWFYSIPGGRLEKDEKLEKAAYRELLEETGYIPQKLTYFTSVVCDRKIQYHTHIFIAKNVIKKSVPKPDNGEKIEVIRMPIKEFLDFAFQDEFKYPVITLLLAKAKHGAKSVKDLLKHLTPEAL